MSKESKAVFIDTTDGSLYERTWGGLEFSVAKLPDRSIKVKVADQAPQVCEERTNEYGSFWVAKLYGGVGIISFKPSKKSDGDYCLLKFSEDVELPMLKRAESKEAPKKKQYGQKKAPAEKQVATTPW